ncbi:MULTISPECIES: hypothetical protein [unclassified Spirosoma]|uniref:hypothetical protein n=1 Tax=unclassified Spirosoma TaxID=2621999 RepID=UPI0009688702|nr:MULTISPECIES: hypothetical protein [unclassified Spirosoma]MBN8822020.1 hypothetical protein [Spirosoma sp.]OJW80430.1 MAG: hypothetical protein BGO59_33640 [Spirosoma sp. 48-14]
MEQHDTPKPNSLALVRTDGFGKPIHALSTQHLEFVGKSVNELEAMLQEAISLELYEKCALIRDELHKRRKIRLLTKPPY